MASGNSNSGNQDVDRGTGGAPSGSAGAGGPPVAAAGTPVKGKGRAVNEYNPSDKMNLPLWERMERFGTTGQPLPATEVYRADIPRFSRKDIKAEKWVVVNAAADPPTMTFINTYDGKAGGKYNSADFTFPLDPKRLRDKISNHEQVNIDDCPVAISAESDAGKGLDEVQSMPDHLQNKDAVHAAGGMTQEELAEQNAPAGGVQG